MSERQEVYEYPAGRDSAVSVGWFTKDKAQFSDEPRDSDGYGIVTGSYEYFERVWLTASEKWVVQQWDKTTGEENSTWIFLTKEESEHWHYKAGLPILKEQDNPSDDEDEDGDETPTSDPEPEPDKPRQRGRPKKDTQTTPSLIGDQEPESDTE